MNQAIISTKGQIVIPQELRERYHLKPNSKAFWIDTGGALLVVPRLKNPLLETRGILKKSKLTQKVLKTERRHDKKISSS